MSAIPLQVTLTVEPMSCNPCGFMFWAPGWFNRKCREEGAKFHCPACGESLHFDETTKMEQLARQLNDVTRSRDFWSARAKHEHATGERFSRRLRATRGVLTKVRQRVGAGVCPVVGCRRHFANLGAHMKTQHPAYRAEAEVG